MSHISKVDLHAFIDGDLTGDREPEKREIEEHLESCEECSRLLLEERNRVHLVSETLSRLEVPEHILDSFPTAEEMKAIARAGAEITPIKERTEARGRRGTRRASFFPEWLILQPGWQAAAIVVLLLGGAYVWQNQQASPPSGIPGMPSSTPQVRSPAGDSALTPGQDLIQELGPGLADEIETPTPSTPAPPAVSTDAPAMEKGLPATDDDLPIPEIRTGETILGSLEVGDEVLGDGSLADLWMYRARAGRTVIIDLLSNDFDAYLFIGDEEDDILAEDDDSGGGTDSRISFTPTESTSYGIVVNSYSENGVGQYALSVTLEDPGAQSTGSAPDLSEPDWEQLYPEDGNPNDRYALIVGIADYPGTDADLTGPDVDAREFRMLLLDEFGFQESNIVTLTDSEATRDHIIQAFSRHLGQAGPDGLAVFFYSGHGTQLEENLGLAGIYDPESDGRDEAILVWGSTENAEILDDEIGILADRLEASRTLIVLDACYSGTGTRSATSDGRQPKWVDLQEVEESLERPEEYLRRADSTTVTSVGNTSIELSEPRRHVLLAASADDEKAYTDPEFGYGVFTRMLVEEMRNASALTTFDEMMDRVQQRTLVRTEGDQTPQTEGRLSSSRIREFLSRNR